METPFRSQHLIKLGLFTVTAADLLNEILKTHDNFPMDRYYSQHVFSNEFGTFGLKDETAYVIVMPDGELALEKFNRKSSRATDYSLSTEESLNILKHIITAYAEIYKAWAKDPNVWKWYNYKEAKKIEAKMTDKLNNINAILKHLNGEELTESEKLIVGRPFNAFEQVELNNLLEELYKNMKDWGGKNPTRSLIRNYIKKIQDKK